MHNTIHQSVIRPSAHLSSRTPTVCVVDPQPDGYEGWQQSADAHGIQLQTVATAAAALRLSRDEAVDLWVINANLPGLSGVELCAMLKSRSPAVPVFLVTDCYSPSIEQTAHEARATLFGVKPAQQTWLDSWSEQHAMGPPSVSATRRSA